MAQQRSRRRNRVDRRLAVLAADADLADWKRHDDELFQANKQLGELTRARTEFDRARERYEQRARELVLHARSNGASWPRIGRALGISAQGAQQRWGGKG